MASLPCAKIIIDSGIQSKATIDCIIAVADVFRDTIADDPTHQAVDLMNQANELNKKAFEILNRSVGA